MGELDWYAHWVGEGGNGGVEINAGCVQGVKEIDQPVVYKFVQIVDELTDCGWYFSRVIPPENVDDGALIDRVIRINHLRRGKSEEGIDGDEDNANRVTMNGTPPLKMMVCCDEEGRPNVPFPKRGEGTIIWLMNQREIGVANLETSQKSVIPSGEVYIRIGYEGGREGGGGKGVWVA